ncbi:ABC transporter permease [Desulfotignum phosphitoxidans]|uniref:Oligopeptide transport system permease protein AppB n=1 Tax=Desulfotignum phosphitoxidans DSM 13687 TaxID=1286635 RepID=S0G033_9BACT|nr:ABC transporter permease [Desulfotignum phosphitoxidans]EMS77592.1 oligopeptide transport system permease protein AppB [Desulfotignum phosphitoxidans DSM 13687]
MQASDRHTWLTPVLAYLAAALILAFLSHSLPRMLPGDFVTAMYGASDVTLTAEQAADLRALYQDDSGFTAFLGRVFCLDWGYSYAFQAPVAALFFDALPWTLVLMGTAHVLSSILGFVLGVEAAWRRGTRTEKAGVGLMTVLEGIPELCSGVLLLLVFALNLGWFPAAGAQTAYADHTFVQQAADRLHHLALPLTTLVLAYFPGNFLLARAGMVMVMKSPFVLTARAKGLPPLRVRYAHAARNALLPLVTRFGLRFAFMITGALVVETLFSYPGLGTLLFNAIAMRDLPLIQGIVLAASIMVLGINLALEFIYILLDPRVAHAS